MANPTAQVRTSSTPWGDSKMKRPLAATVQTYYPGEMIGINAAGFATKCDDGAVLIFDGVVVDGFRTSVETGDAAGDKSVTVDRPYRFTMAIAAAAAADVGKKVFALFSNEVSLAATTNNNVVGRIVRVVSATEVEIEPPPFAGAGG